MLSSLCNNYLFEKSKADHLSDVDSSASSYILLNNNLCENHYGIFSHYIVPINEVSITH